ncbi:MULTISPECIES: DUF3152 domain-containing protein [unclassified Streptomyces]|uniref:DUF3152 domain-containing protein n=1 Tax=unclassified Streptomyces TaxID=2593676 RepID=UPI003654A959
MPAGRSTGRPRSGSRALRRAERRRRLRRTILGATALIALTVTAYTMAPANPEVATVADGRGAGPAPTAPADAGAPTAASPAPRQSRRATAEPSKGRTAPPSAPASPKASASTSPPAPTAGPGVFTASTVAGQAQGQGPARSWRVEVEQGSGIDANAAARAVEAVLGDRRGWIRDPAYGFRLAGPGQPVDFTVKIATPSTTDRLCEVVTPELVGETNCRAGHTVVVNLKRWQEGSPQFSGTVEEYRALIVNHEVGHELGREHETCPGVGQQAPAMMQQIKGLLGCTSNAWPFDAAGTYLAGPRVP